MVLIREVIIERYIKVEYTRVKEKLVWLRIRSMAILEQRKHEIAGCPEECIPVCRHARLPLNYVENLAERWDWVMQSGRSFSNFSEYQIPPLLKILLQMNLPLRVRESQPSQSPKILPSPSPLLSAESENE